MKAAIAALLTIFLLLLVACGDAKKTPGISQTELLVRINDGSAPVVLDVRAVQHYDSGHIPGAINVPHDNHQWKIAELALAKADEIVVCCEDGRSSAAVEKYLQNQGFFEVRHLRGGMRDWRRAGLLTEQQ